MMTATEERTDCAQTAQGKEAEHRPDILDQGDPALGAGLHAESSNTYRVPAEISADPEKLRTLCHRYVDAAVNAAGRLSERGTQTEDSEQPKTKSVETEDEPPGLSATCSRAGVRRHRSARRLPRGC